MWSVLQQVTWSNFVESDFDKQEHTEAKVYILSSPNSQEAEKSIGPRTAEIVA